MLWSCPLLSSTSCHDRVPHVFHLIQILYVKYIISYRLLIKDKYIYGHAAKNEQHEQMFCFACVLFTFVNNTVQYIRLYPIQAKIKTLFGNIVENHDDMWEQIILHAGSIALAVYTVVIRFSIIYLSRQSYIWHYPKEKQKNKNNC